MIRLTNEVQTILRSRGVETFHAPGHANIPEEAVFEPPCSIKWIGMLGKFRIGAFSYAVSGHFARATIGRYCSIGEQVQVGRSNHPLTGPSTSPFFYSRETLFAIGREFKEAAAYHDYKAPFRAFDMTPPGQIIIENDVWIGHGAYIRPGVRIGNGAVIGAMSVVTKDVPPYTVVAGNPASVRRSRLSPPIAAQLQELAWWRFAPWQLTDIDFSNAATAIDQLKKLVDKAVPYAPPCVRATDLMSSG